MLHQQGVWRFFRAVAELLTQTDWTQTEDCPLDIHMKEKYRAYRKYLRDFPQTHDPEVDENSEAVGNFNMPETVNDFGIQLSF